MESFLINNEDYLHRLNLTAVVHFLPSFLKIKRKIQLGCLRAVSDQAHRFFQSYSWWSLKKRVIVMNSTYGMQALSINNNNYVFFTIIPSKLTFE